MSKSITRPLLAGALLGALAATLTAPQAHADEAERVKAVESCLPSVWRDVRRYADQVYIRGDLAGSRACLDATRAALDAGVAATREIRVPGSGRVAIARQDGGTYYAQLGEVRKYVLGYHDQVVISMIRGPFEAAHKTLDWYDTLDEVGFDEWVRIDGAANHCLQAINDAAAQGLSADAKIEVSAVLTISFGQAGPMLCDQVTALGVEVKKAIAAAAQAELDKKLAPYRKVLKGDRIKTFVDQQMIDDDIYGKGGSQLGSPEALARAPLWFVVMSRDGDDGFTYWTLRRFQFKGDRLVKTSEDSGRGVQPPSSRYR